MEESQLIHGDCLEVMKDISDGSIDAIITDPPYGTTACKWDSVIPFDLMWKQLNRIIKLNGAIVLFGSEPFSSALRMSNIKNYRYDWIWIKNTATGALFSNKQPMRKYENISIFYNKQPTYNTQLIKRTEEEFKACYRKNNSVRTSMGTHTLHNYTEIVRQSEERQWYKKPINILEYKIDRKRNSKGHPTQKPVKLMEYLIKTYTNENETVLDFTMGSGSTGVACVNTNRNFIGIELDENYFNIATKRLKEHQS